MPAPNIAIPVISNYLANKLLDLTIRQVAFTAPTPYVGLFSTMPAAGAGTGGVELVTGTSPNYARIAIPTGTGAFSAAAAGSITNANAALAFAAATGAWLAIVGWGIWDALTVGNLLWSGPLVNTVVAPGTALTSTTTGNATGTLASGTYFGRLTWTTANGETTPSPVQGAGVAVVQGTNQLSVTIPAAPTGAVSANLYLGTTSGAETFYAGDIAGGSTFVCTVPLIAGQRTPPAANTAYYTYTKTPGNGDTFSFALNTFNISMF